jgi:hypothetical protein
MFKIESGVPLKVTRGRKPTSFPLGEMQVGDSFLIPCEMTDPKVVGSWRRKLLAAKKRMEGGEWSTAADEGGLRVWRTA